MEIIRWLFKIRNRLTLLSLSVQITWLRLRRRRVEMLKSELFIYSFFILLVGIGLGMTWRALQVEPGIKAETLAPALPLDKAVFRY